MIRAAANWFLRLDTGYVADFADDVGWQALPQGHSGLVVLRELSTGVETEALTLADAETFLEVVEMRRKS